MVYPSLSSEKTALLIYEQGVTPLYDIVWSFDYYLENVTSETEFGFLFFLQDSQINIGGGNYGIDLGYSGLSSVNTGTFSSFLSSGLLGALIGVGFDSTGCFALSASDSNITVRDGKADSQKISNSVAIRGAAPHYRYSDYSINYQISSFSIVDTERKTIRARLGNLGRTLYVDWRRTPEEAFSNVLTTDVTLNIPLTGLVRPGITIVKPISSSLSAAIPTAIVENFHIEGSNVIPTLDTGGRLDLPSLSSTYITLSCVDNVLKLYECTTIGNETTCVQIGCDDDSSCIDEEESALLPPPVIEISSKPYLIEAEDRACTLIDVVSGFTSGFDDFNQPSYDIFNYGYTLYIPEYNEYLYRTDYFEYNNISNTIKISQYRTLSGDAADPWTLNITGINTLTGTYVHPAETYTSDTISPITVIYV